MIYPIMRHAYTPTLPELEAFTAAARSGSATQAAQGLGLTQSAISRSLSTLEARLGVALFHRVRRRLVLSDAGRALLRDAERILADLDQTALTVMSFGGHRDVLRLASLPTFGAVWLMPRLAEFAQVAPEVTFDMSTALGAVDFTTAPQDFAIHRGRPGLRARMLAEERLVTVAAPRLLPDGPLSDTALARLPLLQQATRPNLWRDWFLDAGLDPITIARGARFEQFGMVLAAARAGMGVALVPEVLIGEDLSAGTLARASARSLLTETPYVLSWPDRSEDIPAFRTFRDWICDFRLT
ncbi:LysR substrate-binding domain-containing protein [Marivivens marinus]|uniref:LysR substrate-binding domain-containing protein n=1 Tax=Marivivens marinus TaxID=3110173 RepID=UPI003B847D48